MSKIQIFVSFDVEHDAELYELLLAQSRGPSSSFEVSAGSEHSTPIDGASDRVRRRIREADQVVVICGEHTDESMRVSAELLIAREEGTPYFLLWGRREVFCTKPLGARASEGMYSWTPQILRQQIALAVRKGESDAAAMLARDAARRR